MALLKRDIRESQSVITGQRCNRLYKIELPFTSLFGLFLLFVGFACVFFVCSGLFVCGCVGLVVALFVLGFVCYLGGVFLFVLGFLFLFGVCLVAGWLFGFFLWGG